ncbi:hypothetical protein Scep_023860 [Stephania cephalantha]|uniref:Uncharacterized protein n=1 Tax=Stephania cephalantha TaxID=152367 RepID=A0AAP0EY85_9MAGN
MVKTFSGVDSMIAVLEATRERESFPTVCDLLSSFLYDGLECRGAEISDRERTLQRLGNQTIREGNQRLRT